MPEYSVWKPATISDSASAMSFGVRFSSAVEEKKKVKSAIGMISATSHALCVRLERDDLGELHRAA